MVPKLIEYLEFFKKVHKDNTVLLQDGRSIAALGDITEEDFKSRAASGLFFAFGLSADPVRSDPRALLMKYAKGALASCMDGLVFYAQRSIHVTFQVLVRGFDPFDKAVLFRGPAGERLLYQDYLVQRAAVVDSCVRMMHEHTFFRHTYSFIVRMLTVSDIALFFLLQPEEGSGLIPYGRKLVCEAMYVPQEELIWKTGMSAHMTIARYRSVVDQEKMLHLCDVVNEHLKNNTYRLVFSGVDLYEDVEAWDPGQGLSVFFRCLSQPGIPEVRAW